jgi:hypothetical protein
VPEKFVTVATFVQGYEAALARSLLQAEGIAAMLDGDMAGGLLPVCKIHLQVPAEHAGRATGILAAQAAAALDPDWEDKIEAGVWTCSICGEPVREDMTICHSCQTPRDAIRSNVPPPPSAIQAAEPTALQVATTPALPQPQAIEESECSDQQEEVLAPTLVGDDLAHRAFRAAVFGAAGVGLLLPFSWWYLVRLLAHPRELSRAGIRDLTWALGINGLVLFAWICFVVFYY